MQWSRSVAAWNRIIRAKCVWCAYILYFTYVCVLAAYKRRCHGGSEVPKLVFNCRILLVKHASGILHGPLCHAHWAAKKAAVPDRPGLEFPLVEPNLHVCSCVYREKSTCEPAGPAPARERLVKVNVKVTSKSVRILGEVIKECNLSLRLCLIYSRAWVE